MGVHTQSGPWSLVRVLVRVLATTLGLTSFAAQPAWAETYYVAPTGDDQADGSEDAPFASLGRAQQQAQAGDTVLLRGGEYIFEGTRAGSEVGVLLDKSGMPNEPIRYHAYPGEQPVFNFSRLKPQARIKGFSVTGSWLHLRGFEVHGVQQILVDQNESWAIRVEGNASHNVFEQLDLHHNEGPGLFIAGGGDNLVLNVDSHHNFDPDRGGENADGFGCHSSASGNRFVGCRAWYNSDDGYDFINSPGECTVEHSWAFRNGYRPDSTTPAGNGAGFKGGGFTTARLPTPIPRHRLRFNVAWGNLRQGFYANHHEGAIDWVHNTSFSNGQSNFDFLADEGAAPHFIRNNVAAGSGRAVVNANSFEVDDANNSWTLGITVSDSDFESTSDTGSDGPRQADGSLPRLPFLRLSQSSQALDRGAELTYPYAGGAPDLGAYERGLPDTTEDIPGADPSVDPSTDAGTADDPTPPTAVGTGSSNAENSPSPGSTPADGPVPSAGTSASPAQMPQATAGGLTPATGGSPSSAMTAAGAPPTEQATPSGTGGVTSAPYRPSLDDSSAPHSSSGGCSSSGSAPQNSAPLALLSGLVALTLRNLGRCRMQRARRLCHRGRDSRP